MRLDQYCLINGVEDSPRKKALLMTVGGEDVFDVIVNLFSPKDPTAESVSYDQICEKLNTFYVPAKLEIAERYRFYTHKQRPEVYALSS